MRKVKHPYLLSLFASGKASWPSLNESTWKQGPRQNGDVSRAEICDFTPLLGNTEVHLTHECNKSRFFQVEFTSTVNEEYSTGVWAWEVAVLPSANVEPHSW